MFYCFAATTVSLESFTRTEEERQRERGEGEVGRGGGAERGEIFFFFRASFSSAFGGKGGLSWSDKACSGTETLTEPLCVRSESYLSAISALWVDGCQPRCSGSYLF